MHLKGGMRWGQACLGCVAAWARGLLFRALLQQGTRQEPGGAAQHARRQVLCTIIALGPLMCLPTLPYTSICRAAYSKAAELLSMRLR